MRLIISGLIRIKSFFKNLTGSVIFILLTGACPLMGQDIVSLYKQYIPASVLANKEYTRMVSANLEAKAKIHPDLIYYNIESLRKQMSGKDKQETALAKKITSEKEAFYISKRNQWAIKQRKGIFKVAENEEMKDRIEEYFRPMIYDSLAVEPITSDPVGIDQNLMDFFVVKYLRNDSTMVYNVSTDYHAIRTDIFINIIHGYDDVYKIIDNNKVDLKDDICEKILEQWYVYSDLGSDTKNKQEYYQPYQIIYKIAGNNFVTADNPNFLINAGYCLNNSLVTLSNIYPMKYVKYFSYSVQAENEYDPVSDLKLDIPQVSVSLGYKIYLRKYLGTLSYISLQLGASFSTGKYENNSVTEMRSQCKQADIDITDVRSFNKNHATINSFNSIVAKLSVPLLSFGKSFFIECSANAWVTRVKGVIDYEYSMTRTEGYMSGSFFDQHYYSHLIGKGYGAGTIDINKSYFTFIPSIEIVYETGWGFQLRSTLWSKYMAVTLGYSF